ncbi:hypothetical protein AVEN_149058-1, partial [Araneus ventricosus]
RPPFCIGATIKITESSRSSPNFRTRTEKGRLALDVIFDVLQAQVHGGSLVESDFEAGILRPREAETFSLGQRGPLGGCI